MTVPQQLEAMERAVSGARSSAGDVHVLLRPIARRISTVALRRRGLDLDRQPERARAALGDPVWELVRPNRPPPHDPWAPGMNATELEELIDALARL
jgi:hypothetical protein